MVLSRNRRSVSHSKNCGLVSAAADSGQSTFSIEAIDQREQPLRNLDECLNACGPGLRQVQRADVADFVKNRLATLSELVNTDLTQARAELLRHVSEIRLAPRETATGSDYVAEGEWNLLRTHPEIERARNLLGVRARLVAELDLNQRPLGYEKVRCPLWLQRNLDQRRSVRLKTFSHCFCERV